MSCADRRVVGEIQQAAVVVGQLQLARRAQHALALDAAQLAEPIWNGSPPSSAGGSSAPTIAQRHLDADAHVRRAADDLQQRRAPPTSTLQTLSRSAFGWRCDLDDLADDDAA